ncbi:MAG: hypothetical protein HY815_11155 [Candidatus Riflebacteria bacterium]|nr:hypothetical protein [Candidatus Riflebacteria bacterium]
MSDDPLGVALWFIIPMAGCVGFYLLKYLQLKRALRLNLTPLAMSRGATLTEATLETRVCGPVYEKRVGDAELAVFYQCRYVGENVPVYTVARYRRLQTPFPRVEIYRQKPLHAIAKLLGMQDIVIGDRAFDDAFILKSESEPFLRSYLSPSIQQIISGDLLRMPGELYIQFAQDRILVRKQFPLARLDQLSVLHDATLELARAAVAALERLPVTNDPARLVRDARDAGQPVPAAPPVVAAPEGSDRPRPAPRPTAICQVCGQSFDGPNAVFCVLCETPHHRDCWEYNGRCTLYGCQGQVCRCSRPGAPQDPAPRRVRVAPPSATSNDPLHFFGDSAPRPRPDHRPDSARQAGDPGRPAAAKEPPPFVRCTSGEEGQVSLQCPHFSHRRRGAIEKHRHREHRVDGGGPGQAGRDGLQPAPARGGGRGSGGEAPSRRRFGLSHPEVPEASVERSHQAAQGAPEEGAEAPAPLRLPRRRDRLSKRLSTDRFVDWTGPL